MIVWKMIRDVLRDLGLAIQFLTRLPVPVPTRIPVISQEPSQGGQVPEEHIKTTGGREPMSFIWAFPLVGALIGACVGGIYFALGHLGLGTTAAAVIAVAAGIFLTGALHEDGLADTADGLGGGRTRERKLAIMRDSRTGTYGVLALVAAFSLRWTAIAAISDASLALAALVSAHALSRGLLGPVFLLLGPVRKDGLATSQSRPPAWACRLALALGIVILIPCLTPRGALVALACGVVAVAVVAALARRQLGGYTGDVHGACQQSAEAAILVGLSGLLAATPIA